MTSDTVSTCAVARINGVALHAPDELLPPDELRQRACSELLRQAARAEGLLAADDIQPTPTDGVMSEAASAAIEMLLEQNLNVPEPTEQACRRHYCAHESSYCTGERVRARHILFAVTPGVDVVALRKQVEPVFLDVRCHDGAAVDRFADAARKWSNCPSGTDGGDLGWLSTEDCAPEFARELFGRIEVGVLPRLVHSRFGLHIVEVLARDPGVLQPFEAVRSAVINALRQQAFVTALRQYMSLLAGAAKIEGVQLDTADTPLVQ
jgi:peptidyl-prolyl cis-trans isomerase C